MRARFSAGTSILIASVLLAMSSGGAWARDGFRSAGHSGMRGFSGIGSGFGRPGFGRFAFGRDGLHRFHGSHGFGKVFARNGWRGGAVYLDDDYGYGPTVIAIDASGAPGPVSSRYYVPSISDLPSVAGIRNPPSAEPAFYVVNEPHAPQASTRRISGPRVVERVSDDESGWAAQHSEESFGARIIHLTVPVGAGR